jgi:alkylhydroperoxidase family enzyme
MRDQFPELVAKLIAALGGYPGALSGDARKAALKRAAATGGAALDGGELPAALAPLCDKIARNAYKCTDEDYAALKAAGHSEDQLFELTLCAAVGASWARLDRGLAALRGKGAR